MEEQKDAGLNESGHEGEISFELGAAVLLFYSLMRSLNTEDDQLKSIVFSRLISHLVVTCDGLLDAL